MIARIRAGDAAALDELVNRYWASLVGYAARILGTSDMAEDVAQETFVRIWERREEWQLEGSVRALLYQITRNLALDETKRRNRRAAWIARQSGSMRSAVTPIEHLQRTELEAAFDRAVAALPERRREVFLHVRLYGLSYKEVAEVMGIAPQTVANQLSAALAELREVLGSFIDPSTQPADSLTRRAHNSP